MTTQPPTDAAREAIDGIAYAHSVLARVFEKRGRLRDGVLASAVNTAAHRLAAAKAALLTAATRQQPEAGREGEELWQHFERMQDMMRRYIEPMTYVASFPADSTKHASEFEEPGPHDGSTNAESKRRRMDRAFISDMIHMMDGPEQRALAASPAAVAGGGE